jgi:hypothetical protein
LLETIKRESALGRISRRKTIFTYSGSYTMSEKMTKIGFELSRPKTLEGSIYGPLKSVLGSRYRGHFSYHIEIQIGSIRYLVLDPIWR